MWELNKLLIIPNVTGDLKADVHSILENTPPHYIGAAMHILYGDTVSISDGLTLLLLLVRGLQHNEFFKFQLYLRMLRQ